eukprot:COSAG05_NODE_83_length_20755_cov_5.928011_3_plen_1366_part_00
MKCGADGKTAAVYRFTPRCIDVGRGFTAYCSKIALGVRNGSQQVGWRLGSGFGTVPVAEAQLVLPRAPTSSRGWWLIVPPHRSDLLRTDMKADARLKTDDWQLRSRSVTCKNMTDCTEEMQSALNDATCGQIVVKFVVGRHVIPVRPLFLRRSNVALVVESGVVLLARRGFFHGNGDTLLTIKNATNISVEGPGQLRMWREDYAKAPYSKAEWRAGLNIVDSQNVTVKHLLINNTGGDGIYVKNARQSLLHDVTTQGAYRNGLSIISAIDFLVDSCSFLNTGHFPGTVATGGTAPRAGVDLEPNHPSNNLQNVLFRKCVAAGNTDNAYDISANYLTSRVSIRFEDCIAKDCAGSWGSGFRFDDLSTVAAGSSITLSGCEVSNMGGAALTFAGNGVDPPANVFPVAVTITDMTVHSVAHMWNTLYHGVMLGFFPLTFGGDRTVIANSIKLNNLTIHDSGKHPDQAFAGCHDANQPRGLSRWHPVPCKPANLTGLSGEVTVHTPQPTVCSKANLGAAGFNLQVTCVKNDVDQAESSLPVLKSDDEKTAIARSRWGTNVHWVECSLHEPCPRNPIGPGGGPKPGETAQLSSAFGVVRTGIRWFLVEQQRGVFNFTIYDKLLDELDDADVKLYGILADGNPVYNCSYAPQSVAQQEAFARFAVAIMAHFRGRGVTWELWNEPNNNVNASTYSSLLHTVGAAVRGSVAKKEMLVGPTTSGISLSYIESIAATGALQYLDAISVHPYRATPPETALFDYAGLRAVLKKYSCSHLPLFSSEWGYGSCKDPNGTAAPCTTPTGAPRADDVVTEHEQASRLARMFLINDAANVSLSIWYEWINDVADGVDPLISESNFGAVHRDYLNGSQPRWEKPTFHAAHTLQQLLGGRVPTGAMCDTGEGTYAVRYSGVDGKSGGGDSWAVWLTNSSARRAKCDHRPNMCCRYINNTIIPGCASAEGCKKRGCCWDPNPKIPGYWCSHRNPTGHRNASVLPFTLPGCREVFNMFGKNTSRICPVGTDLHAMHASKGQEENARSGAVFSTLGAEFQLSTDPQYLVPISGQVDKRRDQPSQSGFCIRPTTRAKTDDTMVEFRAGGGSSSARVAVAATATITASVLPGGALQLQVPAATVTVTSTFSVTSTFFKTDDQAQTSLSHYRLDSNASEPPPPPSPHLFNVFDFGALGDGLHDDTDALQRALDAAGAATRGVSDHDDSACAHPTLVFPSGRYKLSRTLEARGSTCGHHGKGKKGKDEGCINPANLRGESALLIQTNASADILYNPSVWHWSITGLHFASGRNHIYLGNNDTNKGFVTVRDCLFANASSAAVRTMGPNWWTGEGSYYSRGTASTQVTIKDSQFYDNERVAVNWWVALSYP